MAVVTPYRVARSLFDSINPISNCHLLRRTLTTTHYLAAKPLPPRPKLNESDLSENFLKGSGPGGQKINKTNSAVQLLHAPTGIVLKCQATRSRTQNRKIARQLLAEKVDELEKEGTGEKSRGQIKAEKERKKKASKLKKSRRKYRALEEGKEGEEEDVEVEVEEEEGGEGKTVMPGVDQGAEPGEETKDGKLPEWERKWRELRGIK